MKKLFLLALCFVILITGCSSPSNITREVTSEEVVAAFKATGLEVENTRPMTRDDYVTAPYVCKGTRFFIPSLGEGRGGRIYICDNTKDRNLLAEYYKGMGKINDIFFSWVFAKGSVLVQINGDLEESIARMYKAAIP